MKINRVDTIAHAIFQDWKRQGLTYEEAAKRLGYKTRQSLYNLFSKKEYLGPKQAKRFRETFGYNTEFLMFGTGQLIDVTENDINVPESVYDIPQENNQPTLMSKFIKIKDKNIVVNTRHIVRVDILPYGNIRLSDGTSIPVNDTEAKKITDTLIAERESDISHLTLAIRDLWNLLRARMK